MANVTARDAENCSGHAFSGRDGGELWIAGRAGGRSGTAAAVDSQAGGATGLEAEPASGGRAIVNHGERPATADCAGGVVAASELGRGDGAGTIQFSVGGALVEIEGCGALSVDRGGPGIFAERLNLPLIRNYQVGREGVRESRAQERATREDITASVVLQYHLVLRAIAIRDAAKARVALAERLSNLAINQQQSHGDRKEATDTNAIGRRVLPTGLLMLNIPFRCGRGLAVRGQSPRSSMRGSVVHFHEDKAGVSSLTPTDFASGVTSRVRGFFCDWRHGPTRKACIHCKNY
jgi:hypothetical protein